MDRLLTFYTRATFAGKPVLEFLLKQRTRRGKEDPVRLHERTGKPTRPRPQGRLVWLHAASVGEAQSALILIEALGKTSSDLNILVTTGTVTSAALMEKRLPAFAFHQYVPLDHPAWVQSFLDHWEPDLALWMESELWPNMLLSLKARGIPVVLVNARLSENSFRNWSVVKKAAKAVLDCFTLILAQTETDAARFRALQASGEIIVTNNIKYSAAPLPYDELALSTLKLAVDGRPCWVYASTHAGEEELACRVHQSLKEKIPNLLTILVPRHIERREEIAEVCFQHSLKFRLRGKNNALPVMDDDIYIADTMGELGLFYTLCPIAMIGRSFSDDGGGGHNPIEAAQLGCAVVTGPNNQFQEQLYADMRDYGAVIDVRSEEALTETLDDLFTHKNSLFDAQVKADKFARDKSQVLESVLKNLSPLLGTMGKKDAA